MSEKINKAIEVTYQAAGAVSGLDDVKMDVYDEGHAIDAAKGVAAMTEVGATGRYYATFTPDAEGEWQIHIDSITTPGKVVKHYTVVAHDVDSVGDGVVTVDGKVDTVDGKVDTVDGKIDGLNDLSSANVASELETYDAPTKAEVDAKIDALNNVSTGDIDGRLTAYDVAKASDISSPPMVG